MQYVVLNDIYMFAVMAVTVVTDNNTYECDFEYGECGWEQSVDDSSDWIVRSATIKSNGPQVDHTFNTSAG